MVREIIQYSAALLWIAVAAAPAAKHVDADAYTDNVAIGEPLPDIDAYFVQPKP